MSVVVKHQRNHGDRLYGDEEGFAPLAEDESPIEAVRSNSGMRNQGQ